MRRGTTPTHVFTLPESIPLDRFESIYMTYAQEETNVLEKSWSAEGGSNGLTPDAETNSITVKLSQADTLSFKPGTVEVQMRGKTALEESFTSDILIVKVSKILKDGEI